MAAPEEMTPRTPEDIAADWFGRRRVAGLSAAEEARFEAWIEADAAHAEAYDALVRAWSGVESLRRDPRVLAMREQALRRNPVWRRWLAPASVAAALLVAVLAGWMSYEAGLWGRGFHTRAYRTQVGEQTTISLPDGSRVTLNTDTVLRTEAAKGRRILHLDRGEAFFQVAKDARRPFVVHAGGRTVTALGTAFEVRVDPGRFEVTLVEGKVRVEAPLPAAELESPSVTAAAPARVQATEMAPGTQLLANNDVAWKLQEIDALRETSWTRGQLVFLRQPLSEVVEELNRYSDTAIVIADADLAAVPITGTFRPGDNEGFARAVVSYGMAKSKDGPNGVIELTAAGDR